MDTSGFQNAIKLPTLLLFVHLEGRGTEYYLFQFCASIKCGRFKLIKVSNISPVLMSVQYWYQFQVVLPAQFGHQSSFNMSPETDHSCYFFNCNFSCFNNSCF